MPSQSAGPVKLADEVLAGSRRALARVLTHVENGDERAAALLAALYPHSGRAHLIGVTGPPGSGKSTLANALTLELRRAGKTVAIVAVDPTSPFSGGAVLGDRIRMRDLAGDEGVFIRSMAARGSLGGLARTTADLVDVLDAAGFDFVLIETVGAGQSEVDIAATAHTTIVVEAPGLGDDVQAIKAGILEIADVLVLNKADQPSADLALRTLRAMLALAAPQSRPVPHSRVRDCTRSTGRGRLPAHPAPQSRRLDEAAPGRGDSGAGLRDEAPDGSEPGWEVALVKTVATEGEGVPELLAAVESHAAHLRNTGMLLQRRQERIRANLETRLRDALLTQHLRQGPAAARFEEAVAAVTARETDPGSAVEALLVTQSNTESARSGT